MARWTMGVAALLLALGAATPVWAGDREDCPPRVLHTDPARVVAACRRLAEQGDPAGESHLAYLYLMGALGVPQDYREAEKLDRKAADQGYASAMFSLGTMYFLGQGVAQDYVQALMWFSLGAAQGDADAIEERDFLATQMTPSQVEKAKALAGAWKATRKP